MSLSGIALGLYLHLYPFETEICCCPVGERSYERQIVALVIAPDGMAERRRTARR